MFCLILNQDLATTHILHFQEYESVTSFIRPSLTVVHIILPGQHSSTKGKKSERKENKQLDEAGRPAERGARKLKKSKRQTCQSIGRMLRVNVSMVTKPFILWILLQGKASMKTVRQRDRERLYSKRLKDVVVMCLKMWRHKCITPFERAVQNKV